MDPIVQGLEITILGLTVTFTALGVFILVMMLLKRIFRVKIEEIETTTEEVAVSGNASDYVTADDDSELIAVIAAAVSYVRGKTLSSLGSTLENGKGSWWVSNRSTAKQGIGVSIKRSGKA